MVGESWLESIARDWIQTLDFITGPRMNVSEMIIPHLTCLKVLTLAGFLEQVVNQHLHGIVFGVWIVYS
jgi:hypothetical protein